MRKIILTMLTMLLCMGVQAQENQYLRELTEAVKLLRKADSKVRDQFVSKLSASNCPKITLMDDAKCDGDEFKSAKANRFRLNQSVVYIYGNQNPSLTSKDDGMLSSKERGIFYSAIEKSIKKVGTVRFNIDGHVGQQEFSVIAYHPTAKIRVTVTDAFHRPVTNEGIGNVSVVSFSVSRKHTVTLTVEYLGDDKNKEPFESFAILNYNSRKR